MKGKDAHNIEAFWHDAYRDADWRGGPVLMSTLAGVEMALRDIKGKDLGVLFINFWAGKSETSDTRFLAMPTAGFRGQRLRLNSQQKQQKL